MDSREKGSTIGDRPPMKINVTAVVAALLPVFLSSCIILYRDFPAARVGQPPELKQYDLLSYRINRFPVPDEGSQAALRSVFENKTPFANTASVMETPRTGVYCRVDVEYKPAGLPAVIFRYVSLATLTALPSWSVREGFIVRYHLFVDGEKKKTFEYTITRKMGLWLGLLPVSWLNWFTDTEAEAFEATARQFFEDARPIFSQLGRHERIMD